MFVVMKIQDFEFISETFPFPIVVNKGKLIGFLPVYETREDALKEFPNVNLVEIREVHDQKAQTER